MQLRQHIKQMYVKVRDLPNEMGHVGFSTAVRNEDVNLILGPGGDEALGGAFSITGQGGASPRRPEGHGRDAAGTGL